MNRTFQFQTADGERASGVDAATLRLWESQGKLGASTPVAPDGTEDWRPLSQWLALEQPPGLSGTHVPPPVPPAALFRALPAPPAAIFEGEAEKVELKGWRRFQWADGILLVLLLAGPVALWPALGGGPPEVNGLSLGILAVLLLGSLSFLLLRFQFTRLVGLMGALGIALAGLVVVEIGFAAITNFQKHRAAAIRVRQLELAREVYVKEERAREARHDLDLTRVGGAFEILAPSGFRWSSGYLQGLPGAYSATEQTSSAAGVKIEANLVRLQAGYRGNPSRFVQHLLDPGNTLVPGAVPRGRSRTFLLDGIDSTRVDLELCDAPSRHRGYATAIACSYPRNLSQTQFFGVFVISAELQDPAKEKELVERIAGSLHYLPGRR